MKTIPLFATLPDWIETITIDNVVYRLRLQWLDRTDSWVASLSTLDGIILVGGERLVPNWTLFSKRTSEGLPTGVFFVSALENVITRENLGITVFLNYMTRAEYDALMAGALEESISVVIES